MVLNKRGVFFTMISLVLVGLFLASYTLYDVVKERRDVQARVSTMNGFLFSTEEDLSRSLYVAGYREILSIQNRITESGSYDSNISLHFQEMFFNGTYDGNEEEIMIGATFDDLKSSLSSRAAKINANLILDNPSVSFSQDNPWSVKVTLNVHLNLSDASGLASWNKNDSISAYIPIEKFEDPLYFIGSGGKASRKFAKTPFIFSGASVENISRSVRGGYYIEDINAPSFLNRLAGVNSASYYGVSSLVDLDALSLQGVIVYEKSSVDYIYFSGANPSSHRLSGMPGWFMLDDAHLNVYNAGGFVI